jgi:hypothetical protein
MSLLNSRTPFGVDSVYVVSPLVAFTVTGRC